MKTAISIPEGTFERVARRADDLGMSRSEFFTRAAERYLNELDAQSLPRQIDDTLDHLDAPDETVVTAVSAGHRVLNAVADDW